MTRSPGTIHLEEDRARILVDSEPEQALAYDDAAGWNALKMDLAELPRLTAIVPTELTLRMALPGTPRGERDLRAMLEVSAPLALRELHWTYPVPRDDGTGEVVTLVKRDWLDPRVAVIRRHLTPVDLLVVDADREPFLGHASPGIRYRRLAVSSAAIAVVVACAFAWQHIGQPPRLPAPRPQPSPVIAPVTPIVPAPTPRPAPVGGKTELVLLGIAGRLPDDADVLVKTPWGKTTTMRLGDTLLGWKLVAVAPDRITLEKNGARDELVLEPAA